MDHRSTNHYSRACELLHNEVGCAIFARTTYIYVLKQGDESFEWQDDTLNMLFEMDEVNNSQAFQVANGKRVSAKNFMQVNFEQLDACKVDMQPTSMMIPGSQMTPKCIEKAESKAACMVEEITKTYARKDKL